MMYWAKRVGVVVLTCGPVAVQAYQQGGGWWAAATAFAGCVVAHQMKPAVRK